MFRRQSQNWLRPRRLLMEQLEDRLLFDAVPDAAALTEQPAPQAAPAPEQSQSAIDQAPAQSTHELIVIDPRISNSDQLLQELLSDQGTRGFEVYYLNPAEDGVAQITQLLEGSSSAYDAIHIFTHGQPGQIELGSTWLAPENLPQHAREIASWGSHLTADADLLFYGCDVAQTAAGVQMLEEISVLSGADVAASDDTTGHQNLGGDWNLEYRVGEVTSFLLADNATIQWGNILAIVGTDAFLQGNYVEAGLGRDAGYGSDGNAPVGFHPRGGGGKLGFVSDRGKDGWATFDGDFFLPGSPEESWGVTLNGVNYNNGNSISSSGIPGGVFSNFVNDAVKQSVDWDAQLGNLHIHKTYKVYKEGQFLLCDVSFTNTGPTALNNVYYMRNVDPDNNVSVNGDYTTTNTILSQGNGATGVAAVKATQLQLGDGSTVVLAGYGSNARVTDGGFFERNPVAVWNGGLSSFGTPYSTSGTQIHDEAMSLAFKFNTIAPGETVQFRWSYQLADFSPPALDLDSNNSSGATGVFDYKTTYTLGAAATSIADTDVAITDSDSVSLQRAEIKLENPASGDVLSVLGSLPSGISVSAGESTSQKIVLTGTASLASYQTALKQLQFSNSNVNAATGTRSVLFEVFDLDSFAVSNAARTSITVLARPIVNLDPANTSGGANDGNFETTYTENGTGVAIATAALSISDSDSPNMQSATVILTNTMPGDRLLVSGSAATSGSVAGVAYTLSTVGSVTTVSFSGSATKAAYQTAIQAITFSSTSESPDTTDRVITTQVSDGTLTSDPMTTLVHVVSVPDAPILNLDPNNISGGLNDGNFVTSFSESIGPVSIDASPLANSSTITDPDNTTLSSLTLTVTGLVDGNREKLIIGGTLIALVTSSTQQVTVNGELFDVDVTLSGSTATVIVTPGGAPLTAALTDFRDLLRSIEYTNTSVEATHGDRVISMTATDAGSVTGAAVTSTIHVLNQFTLPSAVTGMEDQVGGISLGIVNTVAVSPFTINLSGAPSGTTLSAGTNLGGGMWSVPVASIGTLKVISPTNYSGAYNVVVSNGLESETVAVTVTPVADTPILSTVDVVDSEDTVGVSLAGHLAATLADTDGSETLTLQIATIPAGYTLTDGTHSFTAAPGGSTATITSWNLATLFLVPPLNDNGEVTLTVLATATESNGASATNIDTITVTINAVNDPPSFTNLAPSITFSEAQVNSGPQLIDTSVNVSDIDSPNFNGGSLTVNYSAGGTTADGLSIRNQGTGAGQIGFDGTNVTYGGVVIGTISSGHAGASGDSLVISFNANATPAATQALIENLTYANTSDTPASSRTIRVTINDGGAANATASASTVINVSPVNDAPAITTLNGTSFTYLEGAGAVLVDTGSITLLSDPDSTDFTGGVLTVNISAGGSASQDRLAIQLQGVGPGQISVQSGNEVTFGGVTIGLISGTNNGIGGQPLAITLNSSATPAATQALVRAITFENTNVDNPTSGLREIDFSVTDGDGGTSNTATVGITVTAVNDAPSVTDLNNVTFTESQVNGGPQLVDIDLTVVDVDSTYLAGGSLTISYAAGDLGSADDQLSFKDSGTGPGLIGFSGTTVTYGGVVIGTIRSGFNGSNGTNLIVDFTANTTPNAVDALLQNLTYANADDTPAPTRTISVVVNDGVGGVSTPATSQITITAQNDPPVLVTSGTPAYTQDRPAVSVASTVSIIDVDDTSMESAKVTISNIDRTHDLLTLTPAAIIAAGTAGITITSYNPATGELVLSGTASLADYEAVLAGVQLSSTSGVGTDRTITFVVSDGTDNSNIATVVLDYTADTIAPNAPVIVGISDDTGPSGSDGFTSDNTLVITGTAEPNSVLELFLDGSSLGTVSVDSSGNWSFDHTGTVLADGPYTLTAMATDAAGNTSVPSSPFAVVVDTNTGSGTLVQGPAILGISVDSGASSTDGVTSDNTLVINGTAQPNSSLELFLDGNSIGVVAVDSAGNWSLNYTGTALPDGTYDLSAEQTDPAGNTATSSTFTATIDTLAPSGLTITSPITTDNVVNAAEESAVLVEGTAEPDSVVSLTLDDGAGHVIHITTTTDSAGDWTLLGSEVDLSLFAEGVISVSATSTDLAGNVSSPVSTTVLHDSLVGITLTSPVMVDNRISDAEDDAVIVTGTTDPNSTVSITFADGGGHTLTVSSTADGTGAWTLAGSPVDLSGFDQGPISISAFATDPAGNVSSTVMGSILHDSVAPAVPTVQTLITNDQTPAMTGTWDEANSTYLAVTVNGVTYVLGSSPKLVTDGSGHWTLNLDGTPLLTAGVYEVAVLTRDAAGNSTADATTSELTVDVTPPSVPTVDVLFTNDVTPVITGTWAAGDATLLQVTVNGYTYVRDVNNPLSSDPELTANSDGTWSLDMDGEPALLPGRYNVAASNWDPANNRSNDLTTGELTVDITAPLAALTPPDLTSPTDTGISSTDDLTGDNTPTFTGVGGEPDSTVTLYVTPTDASGVPTGPSVAVGTAVVGPTGGYTVTVDPLNPLADGFYDVTVTFTDRALNESDPSPALAIEVDTTSPLNLAISGADTLTIEGDQVVNVAESPDVTISGNGVEPTSTVVVVITDSLGNDLGLIVATVNPDGTWTIPDQDFSGLADGPIAVVATETDAAGNEGPAVSSTLTLDLTPPVAPALVDMTDATDSAGASNTDDLTKILAPTFTAPAGTGVAGDGVTLYVDGVPVATGVVAGDGSYEITPTDPLPEGPHDVTASFTDPAGNEGPQSSILAIVIDITAPSALAIDSDLMNDGLVNAVEAPATVVTGTGVEPTSTVEVTFTDRLGNSVGPVIATVNADGTWTIDPTDITSLVDGPITVAAIESDNAGNVGDPVLSSITLDTTAPDAASVAPNLIDTSDTGTSSTDDLTSITTPTFDGPVGVGEPGSTVTLYVDGAPVGTATVNTDGSYAVSVGPDSPLVDGPHDVTVTFTDLAGNEGDVSPVLAIIVDTTAPDAALVAPNLTDATDSGASPTDDLTNVTTPTFDAPPGTGEPNSTVTLYVTPLDETGDPAGPPVAVGTAIVNSDGGYEVSIDPGSPLADGSYAVTVTFTDPAGNEGDASPALTIVVDSTRPVDLWITNADTHTIEGDHVVNLVESPDVTISGQGAEPTSTVEVTIIDSFGMAVGPVSATVNSDGTWTIPDQDLSGLADGPITVAAVETDAAGNPGPAVTTELTLDRTPPLAAVIAPDLTDGTDSGISPVDDLTNVSTPTFTAPAGTGVAGDVVTLYVDGAPIGTGVVHSDGSYEVNVDPGSPLADGPHDVTVSFTDPAGNEGAVSPVLSITVDLIAPTGLAIDPNLMVDGIVNTEEAPVVVVTGTGVEPTSTVAVSLTDSEGNSVGPLDATVNSDGTWTISPTDMTSLVDGPITITAIETDAAGNSSEPVTSEMSLDTHAPDAAEAAPDLVNGSDSGTSDTDDVTSVTTPTFSGPENSGEPGSTVTLYVDGIPLGTATVNPDGSYVVSVDPGSPLADGPHEATVTFTDLAGNESPASPTLTIVVDTTPPDAALIAPNLTDATDSGLSTTDDLTNETTPTFDAPAGTGEPGCTVTLYVTPVDESGTPTGSPVAVGTALVNDDGSYTVSVNPESPLADGPYDVTVTFTDPAGNEGLASPALAIVIDTTAPDAAVIPPNLTDSTDSGASLVDDLTNNTTPTFDAPAGTGEPNSTVTLYIDGEPVGTSTVNSDGSYEVSVTPGNVLADGPHDVTVTFTDDAGNESDPSPSLAIVVDTTGPLGLVITNADTSTIEGDAIVNLAESPDVTISGSGVEPASTVSVVISDSLGNELGPIAATVNSDGTWTIPDQDFSGLADGAITVVATETDAAGNPGPSVSTTLTLDRTPPVAPPTADLTAATDSGISTTDDLTNLTTPTFSAPPGTGEPGDVVTLYVDSVPVGTAIVNEDGSYEVTPTSPITEGSHAVTTSFTDPAGNEGPRSTILSIVIDISAPTGLAIDPVAMTDGVVSAAEASNTVVSGTGVEPTSTVEVTFTDREGNSVGPVAATVNPDGTWTISPTALTSLVDGPITITAIETDDAGNAGEPVLSSLTLDTTAPDAALTPPNLVDASDTGSSHTDDTTSDTTPTFDGPVGAGEPGSTVTLYIDGTPVGSATVNLDGSYVVSVDPGSPLGDGPHDVAVTFTDLAGNEGSMSPTLVIVVDTTAPDAAAVAPDLTDDTDSGSSSTDDLTHVIGPTFRGPAGTGEPGSTVTLYVTPLDETGHSIGDPIAVGTALVNDDGSYEVSVGPVTPLGDGAYDVTVTFTDPAGNEGAASPALTIVVDTTAPTGLAIDGPVTADDVVNGIEAPATAITGTGVEPTSSVEVLLSDANGHVLGPITATVNPDGTWTTPETDLSALDDGQITVTAIETDAAGNASAAVTSHFVLDTTPPVRPAIADMTDPTDTGTSHTDNVTGNNTPEFSAPPGTGTPGDMVTIYATLLDGAGDPIGDPIPMGTCFVNPDGSYSGTVDPLSDGPCHITITMTDPAGNESAPSAPLLIVVDTTDPDAAVVAPNLTDATDSGLSNSDDLTNVTTPTFDAPAGTGEPGSTVTLYATPLDEAGHPVGPPVAVGTALVNGDGSYTASVDPGSPLADGAYDITVTFTDLAGNEGLPSPGLNLVVDSTAPAAAGMAPNLVNSSDSGTSSSDDLTNIKTPSFDGPAGSGEPGSTVTLYIDGEPVGTAVVNSNGSYLVSVPSESPLADGSHAVTVSFTDLAGNEGAQSPPLMIVVDTLAPNAPVTTETLPDSLTGTGEPGATVALLDPNGSPILDGSGRPVTTTVKPDGTWTLTGMSPQLGNQQQVVLTITDGAGNSTSTAVTVEFFAFDSFNNLSNPSTANTGWTHSEILLSRLLLDLGSEPTLTGSAQPGTQLVARLYGADGSVLAEESVFADAAGNWIVRLPAHLQNDSPRIVIEHISTSRVPLGASHFQLSKRTYVQLQFGTTTGFQSTADGVLGATAGESLAADHAENLNPLNWL